MTMISKGKSDGQRAGFTLLELLVAVSLGTLVMAGMVTTFVWSLRTVETTLELLAS